jgi:hypothetical protein
MIIEYANSYYTLGSIEGITTAIFFGGVGIASLVALSPIVGAFEIWNGCSEYSINKTSQNRK